MLSERLETPKPVLVRRFLQDQLGAGGCTYFPLLSRKDFNENISFIPSPLFLFFQLMKSYSFLIVPFEAFITVLSSRWN
jgi:hypothetical protein